MAAATWTGRCYAHFALPTPFFTDSDLALLDNAVCHTDAWQPVEQAPPRPIQVRRWQRGKGLLILVVLGWYPLLVTIGGSGRSGAAGQRALRRVGDAVLGAGGRAIADAELGTAVDASRVRWMRAVATQRELERHRTHRDLRRCAACQSWSAFTLPHCRSCGHRFTPAEDAQRDAEQQAAQEIIAICSGALVALGRGEGMFPDWPAVRA